MHALLSLIFRSAAFASVGISADPTELHPAPLGKDAPKIWGYIDKSGNAVIPATFLQAAAFSEGMAAVHDQDDQCGYIDATGKLVIAAQFVDGDAFHDGLAAVRVDDRKSLTKNPYGYIDKSGKLVIPAKFVSAAPFSDGFAYVVDEQNKPQFIDKSGKPLELPAGCRPQGSFAEGLALVRNGSKCGFVDPTGKLVIELRDGLLQSVFSEGLASVIESTGKFPKARKRVGFMDKSGKTVIEPQFLEAHPFSEGLALVSTAPDHWAYVDKTGKVACDLTLEDLHQPGDFHDGRATVLIGGDRFTGAGGRTGYIDTTGKLVIPADYFGGTDFCHGLAQVGTKTRALFIDPAGKVVWPKE